jgi:hypothetical protein
MCSSGKEQYMLGADGNLMPIKKNQPLRICGISTVKK